MADDNALYQAAFKPKVPTFDAQDTAVADNIQKKLELTTGERIKSNVDPTLTFADTDYDAQARAITEHYQAEQSNREAQFRSERQAPPSDPNVQQGIDIARNIVNIGFHDELAALGFDWTKDHASFNLDNAAAQWSEHPIRSAVALATTGSSAYFGAAKRLAFGGEVAAEHLVARGLLNDVASYEKLSKKTKSIIQGQASTIAEIASLRGKIKDGTATPVDQAKAMFRQAFGNSYLDVQAMESAQPYSTLKSWGDRVEELTTGRAVTGMLELADGVKAHEGTAILHALKDPTQLKHLSNEGKLFAMAYGEEARRMQKQLLDEGFIDQDTADKVGDMWFSTVRRDSKLFEEGASTSFHSVIKRRTLDPNEAGSLRVVNVPRTSTPHLLDRGLDSTGVTSLIKRQRASEALAAGKSEAALKLIKDDPTAIDAIEHIKNNRLDDAKAALGKEGFIESNPKDLVVKSLLQQKLLFENFRTLRDVAMDPNVTKTYEEIQAMSSATRSRMMSLNKMDNASVLRRMVAKKLGKATVDDLGYIHENLFDALADSTNQRTIGHGVGMLEIGTAMLKTMKTSANPFTHLQNVLGNSIFMHMAGYNPYGPEGLGLMKKSFEAVNAWKDARRSGAAVADIKDLGMLESVTGEKIDIAKELMNPLLCGDHGILDMSSIEASEGIPMLAKLARQASDEQTLAKGMISMIQKGVKVTGVDKLSDLYMAEDSAMKFQYFLHQRMQGLNPLAASNEVARRLPMYGTTGSAIQRGRKVLFPWASFPTEATRIIKNNMMDNPLRTAGWLHAPHLVQGTVSAMSGMSYEEIEKRKKQNPMWAQKMTSVVTPFRDKNDDVRTFILDMLPQSAIYPQSIAEGAPLAEKLPLGLGNPAPIVLGFIQALEGKGSFGQDIPIDPNDPVAKVFSALTSTVGLMMPPLIQKYLFNPLQPGISAQPTLGETAGGIVDAFAPTGLPGARAQQDIGLLKNPSTGKTGSPIYDAVLNNFIIKNYAGSAETEVGNQRFGQRESANYRGRLSREFAAWTTSGNWEQASQTMKDVYTSFLDDSPEAPALAMQNYVDWVRLHSRDIMKSPSFRGLSREDFMKMVAKAGDTAAPVVSSAHAEYMKTLEEGFVAARSGLRGGTDNPLTRAAREGRGGR